ncbi:acyl-CoA dehydrogenase family protein [Hyphomonas sp.]|uniref:acyl-CoA dehydrogenase family protein n=1 Tax=Hyphomonas sp. TaxID=87 RepID=UPI003F703AEE
MDFNDSPGEASFRKEVRDWIDANAPHAVIGQLTRGKLSRMDIASESRAWQKRKSDAHWACLHWPEAFGGRGASPIEKVIWDQEESVFAPLNELVLIGQGMCAPTLMAYASRERIISHLRGIASGAEVWCQMFSEPSAGSDLAGIRTRAERQGAGWVLNGQKIWTSWAHEADFGIVLTRTDPAVPKHAGLTMFYVDMRTPGIEVRPIRQSNGDSVFNEVFLTDAWLSDDQRLGQVGEGWRVALTTLMNERLSIGNGIPTGFEETLSYIHDLDLAGGGVPEEDPLDHRLADWACRARGLQYTTARIITALSRGKEPGPEASIGKLVAGQLMQEISIETWDRLCGLDPSVAERFRESRNRLCSVLLRSSAVRIEGGTDEILKNIIGERVLGLPAEPRVDKHVAFNALPFPNPPGSGEGRT